MIFSPPPPHPNVCILEKKKANVNVMYLCLSVVMLIFGCCCRLLFLNFNFFYRVSFLFSPQKRYTRLIYYYCYNLLAMIYSFLFSCQNCLDSLVLKSLSAKAFGCVHGHDKLKILIKMTEKSCRRSPYI